MLYLHLQLFVSLATMPLLTMPCFSLSSMEPWPLWCPALCVSLLGPWVQHCSGYICESVLDDNILNSGLGKAYCPPQCVWASSEGLSRTQWLTKRDFLLPAHCCSTGLCWCLGLDWNISFWGCKPTSFWSESYTSGFPGSQAFRLGLEPDITFPGCPVSRLQILEILKSPESWVRSL